MNNPNRKHILVGMSGGVDSSVAALLLKQQGHYVEGVFMKNWEEDDTETYCPASVDMEDAQAVCDKIGIELHRINFAAEYWEKVFIDFLSEYKAGRTPNPDILCNKEIKFNAFLQYAKKKGADAIATGHYARKEKNDENYFLLKGLDLEKDQSYFLHALNQDQLAHSLFPLGNLSKKVVRGIAAEANFTNHNKKDSTGICFIGERKFKHFLNDYLPATPGNIETTEGVVLGSHQGLIFYTLGQRQGLNIGGKKTYSESPWYVISKDIKRNVLIVGQGKDNQHLYSYELIVNTIHWINKKPKHFPLSLKAKIRYRQSDQSCKVELKENNQYKIIFEEPQRAITPGQSIVFYDEEICLGGGIIH